MDMDSRRGISVQTRLFLLIVVFTWTLAFAFFALQYSREREYKIQLLDSRLQLVNNKILEHLNDGKNLTPDFIGTLDPADSLRVSIIDRTGKVTFDTNSDSILANHSNRKEFQDAMAKGKGYTVRRSSSTNNKDYFYSATRGNGIVVRSALPYNHSLVEMLYADPINSYLIIVFVLLLTIIAFFASHSISRSVKNLRDFANEAEFGNINEYDTHSFPDDELGEISSHIVNLYKILQSTAQERDKNLREAIYAQKEKTRIKHQLTNNISHEIKTPVQVIQASLETIENNSDLTDEMKKSLIDRAYDNVKRLCSLLNDLSVITRISDAPDQIQLSDVNITEIIKKIAGDMSVYPPERQMRIHINVPDNLTINGNQNLVESIFRNLFVNAFNYSSGRDVGVNMVEETQDYYKFTFTDNGIGVEEQHLPHLFERFYRVDTGRSRAMGGTGLGLSIVKNAVLFHQGTISVSNQAAGGLEFTFTLHK